MDESFYVNFKNNIANLHGGKADKKDILEELVTVVAERYFYYGQQRKDRDMRSSDIQETLIRLGITYPPL